MKHTKEELAEMQALPLNLKIMLTQDRIRGWYKAYGGNIYVSRSGGKDSDVLGDIVKKMYPDVPHVFIDTGLEWISVHNHGIEIADTVLRPQMNFIQVIKRYGYPVISKEVAQKVGDARNAPNGAVAARFKDCEHNRKFPQYSMERYAWLLDAPFKISHKCCDVNKKRPAKLYEKKTGMYPLVATMADESRLRKTRWFRMGCNAFEAKRPVSAPLSFWTEQDILRYIVRYGIDIADIYGDVVSENGEYQFAGCDLDVKLKTTGASRTGCIWCMFGISQDTERFLRLKQNEPKRYEFVIGGGEFVDGMWTPNSKGLGYRFVIDWLNEHGNMNIKY